MGTAATVTFLLCGMVGLALGIVFVRRIHAAVLRLIRGSWVGSLVLLVVVTIVVFITSMVLIENRDQLVEAAPVLNLIGVSLYILVLMIVLVPFIPLRGSVVPRTARQELEDAGAEAATAAILGWVGGLVSLFVFSMGVLAPILASLDP